MIASPPPGPAYDRGNERQFREAVARDVRLGLRRGDDIELVQARLILTAPGGGQFVLTVDDAGTLSTTPLP